MKNVIGMAILLFSTTVLTAQDLTMVTKTTGNLKNQSTTYMTTNTSRTNDSASGFDMLIDYQKGIRYVINHKAKTVTFTKVADLPALAAFVKEHTPKSKGSDTFKRRNE